MQLLQTETIQSALTEGVLTLILNDEKQSANTMRAQFVQDYGQMVSWILTQEFAGVILTSAKSSFFAGGDLKELISAQAKDAPQILASTSSMSPKIGRAHV